MTREIRKMYPSIRPPSLPPKMFLWVLCLPKGETLCNYFCGVGVRRPPCSFESSICLSHFFGTFSGKNSGGPFWGKSMQLLYQPKEEMLFVSPFCPTSAYFARFLPYLSFRFLTFVGYCFFLPCLAIFRSKTFAVIRFWYFRWLCPALCLPYPEFGFLTFCWLLFLLDVSSDSSTEKFCGHSMFGFFVFVPW